MALRRLLAVLALAAACQNPSQAATPAAAPAPADPSRCGHGIVDHGRCVCEPGYGVGPDGLCDVALPPLDCGPDGIAMKGRCYCRPGFANGPDGRCYSRTPIPPDRNRPD
jgi:hypothetical protein